nr:MAG TPA: hypothetical protein [Herelleviridae sp.]
MAVRYTNISASVCSWHKQNHIWITFVCRLCF